MDNTISLANVVFIIFNQCKELNNDKVNVQRIIDYLGSNFDITSEEGSQLQFNELFQLLRDEDSYNNSEGLTEEQFTNVMKIWIPTVQPQVHRSRQELDSDDNDFQKHQEYRLSRSLTNLKQQFNNDYDSKDEGWTSLCGLLADDENMYTLELNELQNEFENNSPHEDPFELPLNVVKSIPRKIKRRSKHMIQFSHNRPNFLKRSFADQSSFSDSEAFSKSDDSIIEITSCDIYEPDSRILKRHRTSVSDNHDGIGLIDLISQLRQIKFKNKQLIEINEGLQSQLESAEENLRSLSSKCLNLEKKNSKLMVTNDEIDDIRTCMEAEVETKRNLYSEKVLLEAELTSTKDHVQNLVDKLSALDDRLEEKERMVAKLKSLILEKDEFSKELQKLTSEKDGELQENKETLRKLSEAISAYEEKIQKLIKEKEDIEARYHSDSYKENLEFVIHNSEGTSMSNVEQGFNPDLTKETKSEFLSYISPWSIKVELATDLVDSKGDNPLCERFWSDIEANGDKESPNGTYKMFNGLMTLITSLRLTLAQYKEQLECAMMQLKDKHFTDEVSLCYLRNLEDSVSLLTTSIEKASKCQNQFNDAFSILLKRISILKNEKRALLLRNEQLLLQLGDSSNSLESDVAEKLCFLEEELRKERLSNLRKQNEINHMKRFQRDDTQPTKCSFCGKPTVLSSFPSDEIRGAFDFGKIHRRHSNIENESERQYMEYEKTEKKYGSSDDLKNVSNANDPLLSPDNYKDVVDEQRDYFMSTEDLSNMPRYKISRAQPNPAEIEGLIENSWLKTGPDAAARRTSIFLQNFDDVHQQLDDINDLTADTELTFDGEKEHKQTKNRSRSSSRSSSNDTSDANSIDVVEERKKLTQELEVRNLRMNSRSPAISLLNSSLLSDDLKSVTPTAFDTDSDTNKLDKVDSVLNLKDLDEKCVEHNEGIVEVHDISKENQQSNEITDGEMNEEAKTITTEYQRFEFKIELPTISIEEIDQKDISSNVNIVENGDSKDLKTENNECFESLKSQINETSPKSLNDNEIVKENRKSKHNRTRRPMTIIGLAGSIQKELSDDISINNDDESVNNDDLTEIKDAIDNLKKMSDVLTNMSAEELESKFSEVSIIYRTDRPTITDRASDANSKCQKALSNVEQEFNILRHLIRTLSLTIEQPSESLPKLKASVNVLEKCVQYLSARSEILGSVQQEMKMTGLSDVMHEYSLRVVKQRDENLKELEEARIWKENSSDASTFGSFDQYKSKRSLFAGKDAKTRFKNLAQNTATKSSIVRQLRAQKQDSSPEHELKSPFLRAASNQAIGISEHSRKNIDDDSSSTRTFGSLNFFPQPVEDSGDALYQRGLQQGLKMNADQNLNDLRAQQSRFSASLDALSDMIEECDVNDEEDNAVHENHTERLSAVKDYVLAFSTDLKDVLLKSAYVIVGFIVMLALLLPWLLTPPDKNVSFSIPISRRRIPSGNTDDRSTSAAHSTTSVFSSVHVTREGPAAV